MAIVRTTPASAMRALRVSRFGQPITTLMAIPINGVIRGAINIAPMTTAVESFSTPIVAITAAKVISVTNRATRRPRSGPSYRIYE